MYPKRLRGTHDVFGDEARLFEKIERTARDCFQLFGFQEIQTPILEEKTLFTQALGGETDVVQKEMYEFEDRSKMRVAMRPEGTAGVVRAYLENHLDKTLGLAKLFYAGPMFRSERPQAGRLRQFHQLGVEQLGISSPHADAETIHCLVVFLKQLRLQGFQLKLNNLGTFEERADYKKKLKAYFKPHEKDLCEDCRARIEKNILRLLDCKVESCRALARKSPPLSDFLNEDSKRHFEQVLGDLEGVCIPYSIDMHMVRGLDYYTKTVFEVSHPNLGSQDAVAAGGRYDRLIETFGGAPAGAVGFAAGLERLTMCMKPQAEAPVEESPFFSVVALGHEALQAGFRLLSELRDKGVPASMDFSGGSLKSQMRLADKNKSHYVFIIGEDELRKKEIVLKDMQNGTQQTLPLEKAIDRLVELHHA